MKLDRTEYCLNGVLLCLMIPLLLFLGGEGCSSGSDIPPMSRVQETATRLGIDNNLQSAADIDALIEPYRLMMSSQMDEILAICPVSMRTGKPEGELGNLVADIVLDRARREAPASISVDVGLVNNGGLRISWPEGAITLGLVFELMPFDNEIYLLRVTGTQMKELASQIAAKGGEPVAGLSFHIDGETAVDIKVGGAEIDHDRDYWIATSNYLAGGGGSMAVLWEPREVKKLSVLIRDAIADQIREFSSSSQGELGEIPRPQMGRITE